MTDTVIPVTDVNAPLEGVTGTATTFNSPFIPPLRAKGAPAPEAKAEPSPTNAAPDAQPDAKADAPVEPPAPEAKDPNVIEYDPDDVFDVTVDGEKREVTLAKLLAAYQKGESATKRFTEAKQAHQAAVQVVRDMTTPQGFVERCRQMQVDPYDLAAEIVLQGADYERMTPEQKELHQLRQEQSRYQAEKRAREEAAARQTQEQQTAQAQARLMEQMTSAMDRLQVAGDPALRSEIISRAAGIMRADHAAGYQVSAADAVQEAWGDYRERLAQHSRTIPVEERLTEQERAALAQKAASERVRVAQTAPRPQTPPRGDDGKFVPARKRGFDMYAPVKR